MITPARGRRRGGRAARRRGPVDRPGPRVHRPGGRASARRRCWSSTGPAGSRPTPTASPTLLAPADRQAPGDEGRPRPGRPRRSAPGSPALEVGGLLGFMSLARCSASSTRSTTRPDGDPPPAGCCWSRPTSSTSSASSTSTRTDFRLWVCLHEETHRVQFTAVPWMRDHLRGEIEHARRRRRPRPVKVAAMLGDGVKRIGDAGPRRGRRQPARPVRAPPSSGRSSTGSPAVMSLLEGHADVVMDGVGPEVIPRVDEIRAQVQPAPQGRRHARPAAAPAARPRRQDGAVPRRRRLRPRASSTRSAWTASTPSGPSPANLPDQGRDRRPGGLGARVHG